MEDRKDIRGLNPEITASYCLLTGYARDAMEPITFAHYTHAHSIVSRVDYRQKSDMCTLYIFLRGKFGFLVGDDILYPSYGDVLIFRDYQQFTSVFYSDSYVDYYQIQMPSGFFRTVELPELFCSGEGEKPNLLRPEGKTGGAVLELLKQTEELILSRSGQLQLLAYGNLLRILGLLAQGEPGQEQESTRLPEKLKAALEYIHRNYTTVSCLKEVAESCGITGTYLSRLFKTVLDCTPNEYLNRLRISEAKYLLQRGSSLTEACYRSGFNNYTYFISKFKTFTGMTPAKFRGKG